MTRRLAVLVGFVLLGSLAGWLVTSSHILSAPSGSTSAYHGSSAHDPLWWRLSPGLNGPRFDPSTAQTTTVVPVEVDPPACSGGKTPERWLAPPSVAYTDSSVTITLRLADSFDAATCWPCPATGFCTVGFYLSGIIVPVQLSEPLRGRALFDGWKNPPEPRPYH